MRAAAETLRSAGIIGVTPDDEEWYDATDAFSALDEGVYMTVALDRFVRQIDAKLADALLDHLDPAYDEAADVFFNENFSALRLATFNAWRRATLDSIDPDKRYLFPWHDLLNKEPEHILSLLADHFHHLGEPDALPEELSRYIELYLSEILKDPVLATHLREENETAIIIENTLKTHWSFVLRSAARQEGYKRLLPEEVTAIGIGKVTRAVLNQKNLSPADQFALTVSAACLAPGMTEEERMDILLDCEEKLNTPEFSAQSATNAGQCIEKLRLLAAGQISANEAARGVLDLWFHHLEQAGSEYGRADATVGELVQGLMI
jgi:hypothetical protein